VGRRGFRQCGEGKKQYPVDPVDEAIGHNIKFLRISENLSQAGIGDKCKITPMLVQKYEEGTNQITARRLFKIAKILGVSPNDMYGIEREPDPVITIPDLANTLYRSRKKTLMIRISSPDHNSIYYGVFWIFRQKHGRNLLN